MYSEIKKDDVLQEKVQTSGQEKPADSERIKAHSKKTKLKFTTTTSKRKWYYQTRSKKRKQR